DRDDARDLIKACLAEAGLASKGAHFPKPDVLGEIFSLAVNTQQSIAEILNGPFLYLVNRHPGAGDWERDISRLFELYAARKRVNNAMDFDDLLALWLKLLRENAEVREHYQRRFQFILVDEYQDTNRLQGDLIDLLAARHHQVMVVGDDAQSIYAWRGANFRNILEFPKRYPEAKVFKIETNYRSTPEILRVANAAIAANRNQFTKLLAAARRPGMKPALIECPDTAWQSAFICQRVRELHEEGTPLNRIAVLYRSHFHALELQLELTRRQIPFAITSGIRFFEQAHIKDATAYLKFVANPSDEISFKRLVRLLPGIAARGADKLWRNFSGQIVELPNRRAAESAADSAPENKSPLAIALQNISRAVPAKAATAWRQFTATVSQLEAPAVRRSAAQMLRLVLDAGYDDYLRENYDNYPRRREEVEQLAQFAFQFGSLEEFLTQLALLTNVEAEEDPHDDSEKIRLSTIHQAKGLEFDVVFVIMLCDGLFPSARAAETDEGEEEERRLFYVAITRAKNELYLSYPLVRAGFGKSGEDTRQLPSRFLSEIPGDLLNQWNLKPGY
ncbi:MAG TPA: 3'-5' exonuclease, partial [Verrucomicrobiae bacterium]|nr:3'-5' exonuclease [Verrucomicrobiae bacterium]